MLVSEIYPDAKAAFEGCDEPTILRRLTDAVKLLSDQGILDPNLSQMDLCVCNGCATLPRDVGTVLGINTNGHPTLLQDQWFEYHINGPGSQECQACNISYEMGQFCTYKDPSQPCYLIAETRRAADNNKPLRVYALDENGNKIFTAGPNNTLQEGFLVPMIFGFSQRNPVAPALTSIYRIIRDQTVDFVRLIAVNKSDGVSQTQIGYYEPDETVPQYRRIKVPNKSHVRIKYKKENIELRSQTSWINCDNRQALYLACRAVKYRMLDKFDSATAAEKEAVRIISNEAQSKRPAGPRVPQIINGVYEDTEDSLLGGGWGWGGRGNY